jgi:predicted DCC family thiol-disulfide oxidoreductase YuxK
MRCIVGASGGPAMADGPNVLFDGVCVFCSASMRFILKHDATGRLHFAALQTAAGRAIAARHGLAIDRPSSFYVVDTGGTLSYARALLFVARHLRRPWRWLACLGALPEPLLNRAYGVLARNRYRIAGRRDACYVPTPAERPRFLE